MVKNNPEILSIKSDIAELKNVELFLKRIFEKYHFKEEYFNRTYLCISEAVINSIKHGNKNDKTKNIKLSVKCNSPEIEIFVEDEGEGFDVNKILNPTLRANIKKESGRGIYIIKELTNELEFNKKGNKIQFKIECK